MKPDHLELARDAFSQGQMVQARRLVAQLLLTDPQNEDAWLLMARLVNSRTQVIDCLQHVVSINPDNRVAQSALQAMQHQKPSLSEVASHPLFPATFRLEALPQEKPVAGLSEVEQKPAALLIPETAPGAIRPPRQRLNYQLIVGSLVVILVILVAFFGPRLAPHDPMQEHFIIQEGNNWLRPPFRAFQVPGFILGSDQFGRDMLSRILYAVRPTLTLVSIVAVVRLILGILIGLVGGWSTGRLGRVLDGLISAALTIPILLVALGAITVLGAEAGLLAFIVGLSINGWGETARIVLEQTRLIRGQLFIESARSLGASSFQIITRHILRQVMPMVWMLFAFEISSTMMVTAGLGFLGYYIGGMYGSRYPIFSPNAPPVHQSLVKCSPLRGATCYNPGRW
jgi:peptide/nickel transport system permease protein